MSEDGTPDEAKEWEDLEGIEQNMYGDDDVLYILNKHGEWFNFLDALHEGVYCLCGKILNDDDDEIDMYEHSGGINVPEKVNKQWVFVTCSVCEYQNSWRKILMRAKK